MKGGQFQYVDKADRINVFKLCSNNIEQKKFFNKN